MLSWCIWENFGIFSGQVPLKNQDPDPNTGVCWAAFWKLVLSLLDATKSMQVSAYLLDATSCLCSILLKYSMKDQRIGTDFIRETPGHQNAYYILMSVFCYARQNNERSYCMNLYKNFATLIMSNVSFVAVFEPCLGQHLNNWQGHSKVPNWQKMLPRHSPLKNRTRVAFIENATPCKQAKLIL